MGIPRLPAGAGAAVGGVVLLQIMPTSGPAVWVQAACAAALGALVRARVLRAGLPGRPGDGS